METKKIALACFIGGVLCCAVARMFAPIYWWLGMVAGMVGGYLGYEFREVREAVPVALRAVSNGGVAAWKDLWKWFSEPRPFDYLAAIAVLPLLILLGWMAVQIDGRPVSIIEILTVAFSFVCLTIVCILFLSLLLHEVAYYGAKRAERCFWKTTYSWSRHYGASAHLEYYGYKLLPLTYGNAYRWLAKGVFYIIFNLVRFFVWTLWKDLVIGTWKILCSLSRFAWHLFRLIHSKKRVLCAIDGTLGGTIAYNLFVPAASTMPELIVIVLSGGLIGAVLGVANWELVSKRVFQFS